jgi:hypothetical protein
MLVQEGLVPGPAGQDDGLLEREGFLRLQVAPLDLDDGIVSAGHSPSLGGNILGRPLAKVLERPFELRLLDGRLLAREADPLIVRKSELGHDIEIHDGVEGPSSS